MRVAHYCQAFSQLSETAIYTWTTELQRQGVDGHVVTHERLNADQRPFPSVRVVPRPRVTDFDRLGWHLLETIGSKSEAGSWTTTLQKRLTKALASVGPEVVHAHFGNDAWLALPAVAAVGAPLVVTFHGYDISELMEDEVWRRRYRDDLWPAASFVTVLSEEMREAAQRYGCPEEKIRIVRVGRPIDEMPVREHEPEGRFTLVSIGRLSAKKGHEDTVHAIARLVAEGRSPLLRIFGGGEMQDQLRDLVEQLRLGDCVRLEGACPNDTVLEALRNAHGFVLCSKTAPNGDREGTPNVFVEAQGMGLPCVSTWHAGIPEMIPEQGHALLAAEGDVDQITDRIRKLMEMPSEDRLALGALGHEKMKREYDLETECNAFRELYSEALSTRTSHA